MGIIKEPQIIKKSKELIHSNWNGILCVRRKPKHVHNPKTPKQISVRSKFGTTAKLASKVLLPLIHPYWNPIAKKDEKSGYILFLITNNPAFSDGILSVEKLKLCLDNGLNQEEFTITPFENRIQLSWDSQITDHSKNDRDQLCLLSLTEDLDFEFIATKTIRKDDFFEWELNPDLEKYYFVFWRNGEKWSDSKVIFVCKP